MQTVESYRWSVHKLAAFLAAGSMLDDTEHTDAPEIRAFPVADRL
jgi:hypothetical protein